MHEEGALKVHLIRPFHHLFGHRTVYRHGDHSLDRFFAIGEENTSPLPRSARSAGVLEYYLDLVIRSGELSKLQLYFGVLGRLVHGQGADVVPRMVENSRFTGNLLLRF